MVTQSDGSRGGDWVLQSGYGTPGPAQSACGQPRSGCASQIQPSRQLHVIKAQRLARRNWVVVSHCSLAVLAAMLSPSCNGSVQNETAVVLGFWHSCGGLCCLLHVDGARQTESRTLNRRGIGSIGSCAIRAVMCGAPNGLPADQDPTAGERSARRRFATRRSPGAFPADGGGRDYFEVEA